MNIIHAHYQPPQNADDPAGIYFWAETHDAPQPVPRRGRAAKIPKPKAHPFATVPAIKGEKRTLTLQLPEIRGIPVPSPQLIHNWEIPTAEKTLVRGRMKDDVMSALRERQAGEDDFSEEKVEEEIIPPLEESVATFFELGAPLDGFSVRIQNPAIKTPLLKRLGEANFVPKPGIEALLQDAYAKISEKAVAVAYGDERESIK